MRYHRDPPATPNAGWVPNVPGGLAIGELARPLPTGQRDDYSSPVFSESSGIGSSLTHIRLSAACAAFDRD